MRTRPTGGMGLLLMVIGILLAGYFVWRDGLVRALPSWLIGLALVAFGWSMISRDRRQARRD